MNSLPADEMWNCIADFESATSAVLLGLSDEKVTILFSCSSWGLIKGVLLTALLLVSLSSRLGLFTAERVLLLRFLESCRSARRLW